jgi:hypothetical protein
VPAAVALAVYADRPNMSEPWRVDIPLNVAGYALRFTHAQLVEANDTVRLSLAAELDGAAGQALTALRLAAVSDPAGRPVDLRSAFGGAWPDPEGRKVYLSLSFSVADPSSLAIQPGTYHVKLSGINERVRGPWVLSWELPGP